MARLLFVRNAQVDLAQIAAFIETEGGKQSAGRVVASIRRTCSHLRDMPQAGRARPELGPDLRSIVSIDYGYVVVYRLRPGIVDIIAIVHGARDIGGQIEHRIKS